MSYVGSHFFFYIFFCFIFFLFLYAPLLGMITCLSACPGQCPTDPACMGECYRTCAQEEADCVKNCAPQPEEGIQLGEEKETEIIAADAASAPSTGVSEEKYQSEFASFVKRFNKQYAHDEFFGRYQIFKANYNKIRLHNMGQSTFSMAVNEFADMTFTEFHSKMTGYIHRDDALLHSLNSEGPHNNVAAPAASIDWRQKNAVTPVKNQQQCGSCWAFSTTGSTEGAHAIKTGKLVSLSEQQLVDCSAAQGNQGCNGGLMDQGFQYIITNKGITTEAAYPYTAKDGTCKKGQTVAATLSRFVNVKANNEADLLAAVNIGPVSVAIEADQQCFQFYSGGILADPSCGTQLDHGVLVVGYGTEGGKDFWIVKNSWGASWGEQGYIRLIRNKNECGIAESPSYPVV
jgi:cathepsin L